MEESVRDAELVIREIPGTQRKQAFKDSIVLGPIDKYLKYNIFPWKFMVHVLLMFFTAW